MSSGRRRVLSYDERVLWATVTKAIEPLRVAMTLEIGRASCRERVCLYV